MPLIIKDADANILYDAAQFIFIGSDKLNLPSVKLFVGSDLPNKSDKSYNSRCVFLN